MRKRESLPDKQVENRSFKESRRKTQFRPGQSGNLNGRPPKEVSIISWIKDQGLEIPKGKDKPRAKLLAEILWNNALKGDSFAIKTIIEYLDGKPLVKHEITGQDHKPVTYRVVYEDSEAE